MVVPTGKILAAEFSRPEWVIDFFVSKTNGPLHGQSTTENHGISPFQYDSFVVLGVPPANMVILSVKLPILHSSGNSSSTEYLPNRSW